MKLKRDENGYIVVETIGCFMLFLFLMVSILSLINVVTVQARVHYALTQTAQTLSMYCYALEATGLADPIMESQKRAGDAQKEIDTFKGNLDTLIQAVDELSVEKAKAGAGGMKSQFDQLRQTDPEELFKTFLNYGVSQVGSALFEQVLQPLTGRYLTNGTTTGADYLDAMHIVNEAGDPAGYNALQFYTFNLLDLEVTGNENSELLSASGDVCIRVTYYIDYTFGALPLPFTRLHITQQATTKAWLGGEGEGYTP